MGFLGIKGRQVQSSNDTSMRCATLLLPHNGLLVNTTGVVHPTTQVRTSLRPSRIVNIPSPMQVSGKPRLMADPSPSFSMARRPRHEPITISKNALNLDERVPRHRHCDQEKSELRLSLAPLNAVRRADSGLKLFSRRSLALTILTIRGLPVRHTSPGKPRLLPSWTDQPAHHCVHVEVGQRRLGGPGTLEDDGSSPCIN
ncbi:hypothetical protein BDP81DRAFT_127105 [Colletotrichum phormii]|uniref:Uncharacterized protein n=1 Tax=Colletotrichum phormii TaxID=359342 RepID=A0AAJ0A2U6_9PEZI|nr:uncharacterized protein BDP81DRAFT_127105 [Colletotrichum phormii]KAK1641087.1 hypothetical protein BDP81DRAFT_127105 [Colletotrichum phormii]